MKQNFNKYIIFWLSQSVSQLGSAMTSFALILWAYTQNGSAITVSLMSFFNYVPYIIVSLFAGTFVDNHSKKIVMLVSDSIAAICSVAILVLSIGNGLQIYHIYMVNFVIGFMNALMGIGGIVGGLIVATGKSSKNNIKMIYVSAMLSFLLGDVMMGAGRNVIFWAIAGFAASFPIPFINAGQNVILYQRVPEQIQGRVFAVRNAVQFSTIPLGILLGGFLADYVFEPFMMSENAVSSVLHVLVGQGAGSGMAVMFLCTGVLGSLFSLISFRKKELLELG